MVSLGNAFGMAVCKHFGLTDKKVAADIKVNTKRDEVFSVTLDIFLTADDLAGIAKHMGAEQRTTYTFGNTITVDSSVDKDYVDRAIAKAIDALQRTGRI